MLPLQLCAAHTEGKGIMLSSLSAIIALPSTPEDLVPLTAITHCHFSSLQVSVNPPLLLTSPPSSSPSTRTPPPHTEVVALLWAETPTGDRHLFGSRIKLDVYRIEMLSLA